ncbi:MAG: hypothetical protein EOO38_11970 [Cytophagaceae bacterium]|nr:MAG: hypothetical protein EOO38_11970 [Cytophagaceae bacterium]
MAAVDAAAVSESAQLCAPAWARQVDDYLRVESEDYVRSAIRLIEASAAASPAGAAALHKLAQRGSKLNATPDGLKQYGHAVRQAREVLASGLSNGSLGCPDRCIEHDLFGP